MTDYTKNGLLLILIGMIFGLIMTAAFSVYLFLFPLDNVENVSQLGIFSSLGGIGGIITLIGGILFLIGRKEFGEKHNRFVIYSLASVFIGIVVIILFVVFTVISIIAAQGTGDFGFSPISIVVLTVVSGIIFGLVYVFALHELLDEKGRRILYIAFFVAVIITSIAAIFTYDLIEGIIDVTTSPEFNNDYQTIFSSISSFSQYSFLSLISSVLWIYVFYLAYKRIVNGELIQNSGNDA